MVTQKEQTYAQIQKNNNDFQALQVRLDTDPLLEKAEIFLRGYKLAHTQDSDGKIITQRINLGVAKANELGIQSILNIVSTTINPQTVQGNFYVDGQGLSLKYEDFLYWFRVDFIDVLVTNAPNWSIADSEIDNIYNAICNLVELFLSRLLNNEERKSYGETMKSTESNVISGGGIPLLNN